MLRKFRNAKKAIAQIRCGEWKPVWNPYCQSHITAEKDGLRLWLGNGAWFCEIEGCAAFGRLWRHWVWWAAARKLQIDADKPRQIVL